jgi:oxygen-independent coproporphyrinogen-3 oxidase
MAGIYLHIPFCKQKCHYCDFHFSTSLGGKDDLLHALLLEIEFQKTYLSGEKINTIYFGGGTPSLLSEKELMQIFDKLHQHFSIDENAEITLEANPDDLTAQKIKELKQTPINRFSIGIQSFQDADLKFMNRAHNSEEALSSIKRVQDTGWENITIDLIYGTPTLSDSDWTNNMQTAIDLSVPHISAYALTVEENTALHYFIKSKKCAPVEDKQSARQFQQLMKHLPKAGFIQYEISNFGKEGYFSKHNSNYWKGEKYLGLGPSAHSFNEASRQWNIANNSRYIQSLQKGELLMEVEKLTEAQQYNDYILTSSRTIWGVNINFTKSHFSSILNDYLLVLLDKWMKSGHIYQNNEIFTLSEKGKLMADAIASDLFYVE